MKKVLKLFGLGIIVCALLLVFILFFARLSSNGGKVTTDLRQGATNLALGNLQLSKIKKNYIDKNPKYSFVEGNTYRNTKYHFSIVFPDGWKIESGDMPSSLQKAVHEDGHSIIVSVEDWKIGDFYLKSIHDVNTPQNVSEMILKTYIDHFPDANQLGSGEVTISGQPAYWSEIIRTHKSKQSEVKLRHLVYSFAQGHYFYIITATAEDSKYEELKPTLIEASNSFIF